MTRQALAVEASSAHVKRFGSTSSVLVHMWV